MADQREFRLGPVGFVRGGLECEGCGERRPAASQPCPVCGRERDGYAGQEYPTGKLARWVWVNEQEIYDRNAFAVLMALAYFDKPNGKGVFPSMKRLAKQARLSERVARDGVRWLERHGWIVCEQRRNGGRQTSNRYTIRQAEQTAVSAGSQAAVSADHGRGEESKG